MYIDTNYYILNLSPSPCKSISVDFSSFVFQTNQNSSKGFVFKCVVVLIALFVLRTQKQHNNTNTINKQTLSNKTIKNNMCIPQVTSK